MPWDQDVLVGAGVRSGYTGKFLWKGQKAGGAHIPCYGRAISLEETAAGLLFLSFAIWERKFRGEGMCVSCFFTLPVGRRFRG